MDTPAYSVLVVDDNEVILRCMRDTVDWPGHGMTAPELFRSAEEAMDRMAQRTFDVAVIDIQLPGMTGLELVAWMHEHSPEAEMMVISAYGEFEFARQCVALGVHQYLLKPFQPAELREALNQLRAACDSNRSFREQFLHAIETCVAACDRERLVETLRRLRDALNKDAMFFSLVQAPEQARGDVRQIADALLARRYGKDDGSVRQVVDKVMSLIERDYSRDLSLGTLAGQFGVSPTYLSTMFRRETGETFTEALVRVRMAHADQFIRQGVAPGSAAERAGYCNYKSFYKTYRNYFGKAPTDP